MSPEIQEEQGEERKVLVIFRDWADYTLGTHSFNYLTFPFLIEPVIDPRFCGPSTFISVLGAMRRRMDETQALHELIAYATKVRDDHGYEIHLVRDAIVKNLPINYRLYPLHSEDEEIIGGRLGL